MARCSEMIKLEGLNRPMRCPAQIPCVRHKESQANSIKTENKTTRHLNERKVFFKTRNAK